MNFALVTQLTKTDKLAMTTIVQQLTEVLNIIGVARIFAWEGPTPQITCIDVIRNLERGTFCEGKDIIEWKIRSLGLVLACN